MIDTSFFGKKADVDKLDIAKFKHYGSNLSNLKKTDKEVDVDKLVPAPVDLSKLKNVVKRDVV